MIRNWRIALVPHDKTVKYISSATLVVAEPIGSKVLIKEWQL